MRKDSGNTLETVSVKGFEGWKEGDEEVGRDAERLVLLLMLQDKASTGLGLGLVLRGKLKFRSVIGT